jgi:hypothetical protein
MIKTSVFLLSQISYGRQIESRPTFELKLNQLNGYVSPIKNKVHQGAGLIIIQHSLRVLILVFENHLRYIYQKKNRRL